MARAGVDDAPRPRERTGGVGERESDASSAEIDAEDPHDLDRSTDVRYRARADKSKPLLTIRLLPEQHFRDATLARLAVVVAALAVACEHAPPADSGRPKLVILGFDGLDPDLVQRWMARPDRCRRSRG